jgi:uncharacterized membrane protein YgcG
MQNKDDDFQKGVSNILDALNRVSSRESLFDEGDNLDRNYNYSNKKHRNKKAYFDHWFEIMCHPFIIFISSFILLIASMITKYIGMATKNEMLLEMSTDFWVIITYVGTAIITHIITKFIDRKSEQ